MTEYRNNKHAQQLNTVARTWSFPTNEDFSFFSLNSNYILQSGIDFFFCFTLFCSVMFVQQKREKSMARGPVLTEFGCHLVRLFEDLRVVEVQGMIHPDDLTVGQLQAMFQHTRE